MVDEGKQKEAKENEITETTPENENIIQVGSGERLALLSKQFQRRDCRRWRLTRTTFHLACPPSTFPSLYVIDYVIIDVVISVVYYDVISRFTKGNNHTSRRTKVQVDSRPDGAPELAGPTVGACIHNGNCNQEDLFSKIIPQ